MKKKPIILSIFTFALVFQAIFLVSTPNVRAAPEIPEEFYQTLNLNGTYVYNVTQFGGDLNWIGFNWASKYNTTTNSGGQISVNFTGFYDKDPDDIFNLFGSPMSYMDIEFIENQIGMLFSNHTFNNVSNGEAAFNMLLGYNTFQSGFLVPINNLTKLKEQALAQDVGFMTGDITIEETYSFISFDFKQDSGAQNTTLVYEKQSGLLVWARTKMIPITNPLGYTLEMFLINFSLDFDELYVYNVSKFEGAAFWYDWDFNYIDTWTTNPGGLVTINFTDYYLKDLGEPVWAMDAFPSDINRAWFDIEIFYKGFFGPIGPIISLNNISNREAALQMGIGFGGLQSGFMIPSIDNTTFIKELALAAANPGEVTITETELTIKFSHEQVGGFEQKTHLIYEKRTGLLLWVDTFINPYVLEMTIVGFSPPITPSQPTTPNELIPAFPILYLGIMIVGALILITTKTSKKLKFI
ncbi:MAG TPA: hypothetical protein VMV43_13335 [Candidatus Nanopelagicaceae bacterium]|nr:hypothetical protein [Candidatus Nanopelagicaceae bacterium]